LISTARQNDDVAAIDREVAGAFDSRALGVPDVVEPANQLRLAHVLPGLKGQRARKNSRHRAIALSVQPVIDDAAVRHVQIGDGAEHDHAHHAQDNRECALVRRQQGGPAEPRDVNAPAAGLFFLGHC
jgi:hypothetical protein